MDQNKGNTSFTQFLIFLLFHPSHSVSLTLPDVQKIPCPKASSWLGRERKSAPACGHPLFIVTHLDLVVPATSRSRGIQSCFDEVLFCGFTESKRKAGEGPSCPEDAACDSHRLSFKEQVQSQPTGVLPVQGGQELQHLLGNAEMPESLFFFFFFS